MAVKRTAGPDPSPPARPHSQRLLQPAGWTASPLAWVLAFLFSGILVTPAVAGVWWLIHRFNQPPGVAGGVTPSSGLTAADWQTYGGISMEVADTRRSFILDTRDTTETWRSKWSGVVAPAFSGCGWKIRGAARSLSHAAGTPGGFGLGLASFGADEAPSGFAAQFDYGFSGYRAVSYPNDNTFQRVEGTLDHEWHRIDVALGSDGHLVMKVDDRVVLDVWGPVVCGYPIIRVWAGRVEFADLAVDHYA